MANVVRAHKGHYTVEFSFDGETYYVVNDFKENGERDIRIYTEQEYLLEENNPEALFRLWDTAEESGISGELPAGIVLNLKQQWKWANGRHNKPPYMVKGDIKMDKKLSKNIQVLRATRHEFMARFDFEGVGYIAFSSDWSNAENVDQWTILYNEDDYKTCEHDNTVPTMLYDEYDQDGVRGCRGEISHRLKEAMEEALSIAEAVVEENYLDCVIECEENINRSESLHEVK